jgi:hypothetical protein
VSFFDRVQHNSLKQCAIREEQSATNQMCAHRSLELRVVVKRPSLVQLSAVDSRAQEELTRREGPLHAWERQHAAPHPYRDGKSRA